MKSNKDDELHRDLTTTRVFIGVDRLEIRTPKHTDYISHNLRA